MPENCVNVNYEALLSMQDLLQDQFEPTLQFCMSEFDRLQQAIDDTINVNIKEAIRHSHSLKSNAAQFGAESLSQLAKNLEHSLIDGDLIDASRILKTLPAHIISTKSALSV